MTANSAGCTTSARSSAGAPAFAAEHGRRATSSRDGASARSHSKICSRNTGEASRSARPMPGHCEPCPGNTSTHLPSRRAPAHHRARRRRPPRERLERGQELRPIAGDDRGAVLELRARGRQRPRHVHQRQLRVRRQVRPQSLGLQSRSAAPRLRAETRTTGRSSGRLRRSRSARFAASAGASSRITCALVPEMPNELTPAWRGRPRRSPRATAAAGPPRPPAAASQSMCGFGSASCAASPAAPRGGAQCDHLRHARQAGRRLEVADVGLQRAPRAAAGPPGGPGRTPRRAR